MGVFLEFSSHSHRQVQRESHSARTRMLTFQWSCVILGVEMVVDSLVLARLEGVGIFRLFSEQ